MDVPLSISRPVRSSSSSSDSDATSTSKFKTMADYKVLKEIGEGSFSIVYHAQEKTEPKREVALKMCLKRQIIRDKRVKYVHREKEVLAMLSTETNQHPFVVALYATFQDAENLFFVLSYAQYGDLLHIMLQQATKRFTLNDSRYYAASLLTALEHIHKLGVIHRDVKPENVLVKSDGRIMISDFGSAMLINNQEEAGDIIEAKNGERRTRRCSFVGTAQYVSPEMLHGHKLTPSSDFWSLAVVLFQFLTGEHAFHDESEYLIFKRVERVLFKFPDGFDNEAIDLIEKILVEEPSKRPSCESIKTHIFFSDLDWKRICELDPPAVHLVAK